MPVELHVIRANEFICLDPDEHLDFEASKKALQTLAQACRKRGIDRAMVDLRDIPVPDKPKFTTKELAALVNTFHEAGFTRKQRLAVLYEWDVYGGVRNFTFFSRLRGLQVQAFHEFETAMLWLWKESENPAEMQQWEVVPVARREPKKRLENLSSVIRRTPAPPPVLRTTKRHHK
jgi:hypothetical protein